MLATIQVPESKWVPFFPSSTATNNMVFPSASTKVETGFLTLENSLLQKTKGKQNRLAENQIRTNPYLTAEFVNDLKWGDEFSRLYFHYKQLPF